MSAGHDVKQARLQHVEHLPVPDLHEFLDAYSYWITESSLIAVLNYQPWNLHNIKMLATTSCHVYKVPLMHSPAGCKQQQLPVASTVQLQKYRQSSLS